MTFQEAVVAGLSARCRDLERENAALRQQLEAAQARERRLVGELEGGIVHVERQHQHLPEACGACGWIGRAHALLAEDQKANAQGGPVANGGEKETEVGNGD